MKTVPNRDILDLFGETCLIPEKDGEGQVKANSYLLLQWLLLQLHGSLLRQFQRPEDGLRAYQLWAAVDKCKDCEELLIPDEEYQWYQELLSRDLPVSNEAQKQGLHPRTLAAHLWGLHEWTIANQLKGEEVCG